MKNPRPLVVVCLILIFFVGFVMVITCESEGTKAKKELAEATSYDQIRHIWDRSPKIRGKADWENIVEQKILSLKLTEAEKQEIENWYPVRRHLNITIVPDLSNRLKQFPDQPKFDTIIINHIWKSFQKTIRPRYRYGEMMHDRLAIDISDREAARGQFKEIANELIFDLSSLGSVSPIVHLRKEEARFEANVQELYQLCAGCRGADYLDFFDNRAGSNIKKSTIFDRYRNIAILITDGYLEVTLPNSQIKSYSHSPIPVNPMTKLAGLEILMLEIQERRVGDYQNNRKLWYNWLSTMGANVDYNHFFQSHNEASNKTKTIVDEFLQENTNATEVPVMKKTFDGTIKNPGNSIDNTADKATLVARYIALGDAKCKEFKEANTPQLYHIANEYYNYAAELANSTPKVCE